MNMREIEAQAKALAPVIKGFVEKAFSVFKSQLAQEMDDRDRRLLDVISESLEGLPTDAAEIAQSAAKLIEVPKDGKDADPEDIRRAVAEEVAKLPKPEDGRSVTLDDVAPLIAEQVSQAVAALPAPEPGEPGKSVSPEDVRQMIAAEVAKAVSGLSLPKDGDPGRDALDIEILPEIDEEKSYPRSTYARHRGGLWRSFERTNGIKGWDCIVDGVGQVTVDQSGDRSFDVTMKLSSGAELVKSIVVPVMIYRGVFQPGAYAPGDTVTWAGSLWHCDESTADKPGEVGSKGWRLAVKRGRDGKDGINGKDLTKGVALS